MELAGFLAALDRLTADDLALVAKSLDNESMADEVDWWRATIALDRALRHARATRAAGLAAAQAAAIVQARAAAAGIGPDSVAPVVRSAADVARGCAAGPAARPIVALLLDPWSAVLPAS